MLFDTKMIFTHFPYFLETSGMRRLNALFKENAGIQALASQVNQLASLQKIWSEIAPPALQLHSRVGGITQRRITVFADNGAVAAKLKLLAPTLLKNLQIKGVEVTSIRVEVQVKSVPKRPKKAPRDLSESAAGSLSSLAGKLPESPLRTALERLASKGRKAS